MCLIGARLPLQSKQKMNRNTANKNKSSKVLIRIRKQFSISGTNTRVTGLKTKKVPKQSKININCRGGAKCRGTNIQYGNGPVFAARE